MTLAEIDFADGSATAGYWAAPWARNRGATTRALNLVCAWGFGSLGIDTVNLMTLPGNLASERVAERRDSSGSGLSTTTGRPVQSTPKRATTSTAGSSAAARGTQLSLQAVGNS